MRIRPALIALFSALWLATPVRGDGLQPYQRMPVSSLPDTAGQWSFRFTVYGWIPWLNGNATVKGRQFDVDIDPKQLFGHLDWSTVPAWMSYAEARRGPVSLFNDIVYANVTDAGHALRVANRRFITASVGAGVDVDYEQVTIELGGAYEVWAGRGMFLPGTAAFDILGGARYWHQQTDVSVRLNAALTLSGPLGIADLTTSRSKLFARSGGVDWVDPFIGVRYRQQVLPGHELSLRGDVGGFGVGSDFTWQVLATYNFQICTCTGYVVDGYAGYRALSVDYEQGSSNNKYVYDVVQHGPVLGLTVRF